MNKLSKILIAIIVVLVIVIAVVTSQYFSEKKAAKENLRQLDISSIELMLLYQKCNEAGNIDVDMSALRNEAAAIINNRDVKWLTTKLILCKENKSWKKY